MTEVKQLASRELERRLPKERPPHLLVEDIGFVFHSGMFIVHFQDVLFIHNHIAYDFTKSLLRVSVSRCSFSLSRTVPSHRHRSQMPLRNHSPSPRDCNFILLQLFHPVPPMARENHPVCFPFHPQDLLGTVWEVRKEGLETGLGDGSASDTCVQQV